MEEAQQQPRAMHAGVAGLFFALAGVVDGIVAIASTDASVSLIQGLMAVGLSASLWALAGTIGVALTIGALRLAGAGSGAERLLARLAEVAKRLWAERGSTEDRDRVATLLALLTSLGCWFAVSALLLTQLIIHRNGPTLIAVTFLVAQLGIVGLAAWVAAVVRRGARWLLARPFFEDGAGRRVAMLPTVVALLGGGGLVSAIVFAVMRARLLVDLGLGTWAMLAAAAIVAIVASVLLDLRALRSLRATAGLLVVAVALLFATASSGMVRRVVATDSISANVLLSTLQSASDVDHDQSAWLPAFEDCGPFDPDRGPLAVEHPEDGVDSNCDGSDNPPEPVRGDFAAIGDAVVPNSRPNLILVTVDSWREDTTGFGTGKKSYTPRLDEFSEQAFVFTSSWSQDSGTGPSIWSLMAGKTPFQTKIDSSGRFPPSFLPEEKTLAEHLKRGGYRTSALLCGAMFGKRNWNISRGFDEFDVICKRKREKLAEPTAKRAIKRLRELREKATPFFLWVHFYDPHRPYADHPELSFGKRSIDHYREEVHYTDEWLGRFLAEVKQGADQRTYVAVTADHGENFREHGRAPHARTLYREVTRVPLVMWGSDVGAAKFDDPVAVNDIHPTFLELARLPFDHSTMVSHAPVLFGARPSPQRLVFQENSFSRPRRHVKGVVGLGHHMLYDSTNDVWELFALSDTREKKNLAGTGVPEEEQLKKAIRGFIPTTKIPSKLAK